MDLLYKINLWTFSLVCHYETFKLLIALLMIFFVDSLKQIKNEYLVAIKFHYKPRTVSFYYCICFFGQPEPEEWRWRGKYSGLLRKKSEVKHYLNEPTFNELLISRKKAMIDLREDHLSRSERSRGRRSEVGEVGEEIVWWSPRSGKKVEEIKKKKSITID